MPPSLQLNCLHAALFLSSMIGALSHQFCATFQPNSSSNNSLQNLQLMRVEPSNERLVQNWLCNSILTTPKARLTHGDRSVGSTTPTEHRLSVKLSPHQFRFENSKESQCSQSKSCSKCRSTEFALNQPLMLSEYRCIDTQYYVASVSLINKCLCR